MLVGIREGTIVDEAVAVAVNVEVLVAVLVAVDAAPEVGPLVALADGAGALVGAAFCSGASRMRLSKFVSHPLLLETVIVVHACAQPVAMVTS